MATLASLFFSGSSSFLQVTRITTISQMSSNFNQIRPLTVELSARECLKNQYFVLGHSSIFVFQWIFFILAGNKNNYNISDEFEFRPDPTSECGFSCPLVFEKSIFCIVATLAPSIWLDQIFFILGRNMDSHNILDDFEFELDSTQDCGVSCPLVFEKSIFSVVATRASSILIRSSKEKKTLKKRPLCLVTVLVDSQVSDRCPWATCYIKLHLYI